MADHMRTELVTDALESAVRTRSGRVDGVIFHSDHGAQYGANAFAETCHRPGIRRSMGAVGTSAYNAAAESFYASLKREILPGTGTVGQPHEPPVSRTSAGSASTTTSAGTPRSATSPRSPTKRDQLRRPSLHDNRCVHDRGGSPLDVTTPSTHQRLCVAELAEQDRRIVRSGVANSTIRADERLRDVLTAI
ncbi:DDE-type integrase/transposase/recombinase [Streptomyces sp. NPDC006691]|uniref:DDE-type integrase/transposase/recombinase n=1 Tax=Streptomyces sp. NPDC006691 TaxID=3364757 RepID=UPI003691A81B